MKFKALTTFKHDKKTYTPPVDPANPKKDEWYTEPDELGRYFLSMQWAEDEFGNGAYPAPEKTNHELQPNDSKISSRST